MSGMGGQPGLFDFHGTEGADTLVGDEQLLNVILGFGGDDALFGGSNPDDSGFDRIYGGDECPEGIGSGDDSLFGYDGLDELYGQDGDDLIYGGHDTDMLYGGAGNDTLAGGAGGRATFGSGRDEVYGGAGDDVLLYYWYDLEEVAEGFFDIVPVVEEDVVAGPAVNLVSAGTESRATSGA
ncbi:MAG: hypothetical protein AAGF90_10275, partial [Pseudomonadota bacterium]